MIFCPFYGSCPIQISFIEATKYLLKTVDLAATTGLPWYKGARRQFKALTWASLEYANNLSYENRLMEFKV